MVMRSESFQHPFHHSIPLILDSHHRAAKSLSSQASSIPLACTLAIFLIQRYWIMVALPFGDFLVRYFCDGFNTMGVCWSRNSWRWMVHAYKLTFWEIFLHYCIIVCLHCPYIYLESINSMTPEYQLTLSIMLYLCDIKNCLLYCRNGITESEQGDLGWEESSGSVRL